MMADMRLIDANAMRNDWLENGENEYVYDTNAVLDSIDAQPTIDAVPVVRCKECKYYDRDECQNPYIFMSDGAHLYTQPDDFCSYGERKDDGA